MAKIKKIKFRRSDYNRAMLTDTLPYEVPLLFSNEGYYDRVLKGTEQRIKTASKIDFFDEETATVAYTYSIKKDAASMRALSVMHPAIQKKIGGFYAQYAKLIIGLCNRSHYSLRRPFRVASHYYERNRASRYIVNTDNVEQADLEHQSQQKNSSSFFTYKDFTLIHKFYESQEFIDLEKRFRLLRTLDISKCFPHIYTHSISWAVKSKEFAKDNRQAKTTFDAKFDEIMRLSNHDETNGILVGPETSRIFAEIVLQGVDSNIDARLHGISPPIALGVDYAIRRYVDDYFIFANSLTTLSIIEKVVTEELERYKLYLNEAKSETFDRPFLTGQTTAKLEIASIIDELFFQHILSRKEIAERKEELTSSEADPDTLPAAGSFPGTVAEKEYIFPVRYIGNADALASSYIRRIKSVLHQNEASFDHVANYFFSVIRKYTLELLERIQVPKCSDKEIERLSRFIKALLQIIFFVLSMSPRVRPTYQICQICLALNSFANALSAEHKDGFFGAVANNLRGTIFRFIDGESGDNIEMLNLLIVLHSMGENYSLGCDELCEFFGISLNRSTSQMSVKKDFRYFQIMALLHYVGDAEKFQPLKDALQNYVYRLFEDVPTIARLTSSADLTMLIFDYIRCPFVANDAKKALSKLILRRVSDDSLNSRSDAFIAAIEEGDWFFRWKSEELLGALLWKKELRPAY